MRIVALLCGVILALQPATSRPAVPLEPAAAIVDAFRTHSVVAVTAGHGDARGYAFGRSLVNDPRIAAVVDDIVIEERSAKFQELSDRFVRGEAMAIESLRPIWRETTQPGLGFDEPWEAFFTAVRAVNAAHAGGHQLRVLLGDPPIEWEQVITLEDHRKWIEMREWYPADLIQREVLAKARHALLFYGDMHFQRKNMIASYESEGPAETIVSRLESKSEAKIFTIFTAGTALVKGQADVASWPAPSLAVVRGTVLGALDFTFYYPSEALGRIAIRDGKPDFSAQIPREQWKTLRAEEQFDAVLYTGEQTSRLVHPSPDRCADKTDLAEHLRRATLTGIGVNALKALCGM